ncbi:cytochrome P450 [Gynuella sunshinyii]|uniref:Cytochrome P450 n=1 Tax=Gynuella sunshinyii YC6258 TaxID=1445510 RepID=A0A0C5VE88_9GAMM|nr:cytochrome P450 [Gynuella sunshinyii]AJQ92837.1 cytochrome P450 [Gynuella sunshinyii YC6258]
MSHHYSSHNTLQNAEYTDVDLHSTEFISNPFPAYQALLQQGSIYQSPSATEYYVVRPSQVERILKDNKTFLSDRTGSFAAKLSEGQHDQVQPLLNSLAKWLLFQDPPKHMPLRKIVNASLSHKLVSSLEPDIRAITRQLVTTMVTEQHNDLVNNLSYPLPALVIARLLGVPAEDILLVKKWSDDIASFTGAQSGIDIAERARASVVEMSDYLQQLLHSTELIENTTVLGNLTQFRQQNDEFTEEDLIANCIMLLFAGHETTTCLINNLWIQLQQHDSQRLDLIRHPELISSAVEEGLRYDGAVHRLGRFIKSDTEIDGIQLQQNRMIYVLLGAANRSPELCERPDKFDIRRKPVRNFGFGFGPHLCSGAALARLEAEIATEELLKLIPEGHVMETPEYHRNLALRSVKSLKIKI